GQGWFNVDQSRFLTPEGGEIHWSRLPDIFIGGLILLMRPILGQDGAELFALIVYPLALFAIAMAMVRLIAKRLGVGVFGQIAAIALFALSSAALNFWPGRIDHHNLVLVLILTGLAALLSRQFSAKSAVIASACCVAALSVAIESLPYVGALVLLIGLFWIVRGHIEGVRLSVFGLGLIVFAVLFYSLDAPGYGPRRGVCDAYGLSHFAALLSGGALLALLGVFGGWLDTLSKRLVAGAVAGGLTVFLFAMVNPSCLGDPYAEISDYVRMAWLSAVAEARSLGGVWDSDPGRAVSQFGFVLTGLMAAIFLLWKADKQTRLARFAVGFLMLLSAIATIWQIRGVYFSHAFAAIAGGALLGVLFSNRQRKDDISGVIPVIAVTLLVLPTSWATASRFFVRPAPVSEQSMPNGASFDAACVDPKSYKALADLPDARVLTPIDLGMVLLVHTDHSVYGGPYHRNILGIERVTRAFMSEPDTARAAIQAMGASHVLYCAGLAETARYARLDPGSFASEMEQGRVPDWLIPADQNQGDKGVVRLYRVGTE
ncbi:MAG: hypothetical protein AAGH90_04700, partial [Pseudomonadota bacterium]